MFRSLFLVVLLLGLAAVAARILFVVSEEQQPVVAATPPPDDPVEEEPLAESPARTVRNVTPPGVMPGPVSRYQEEAAPAPEPQPERPKIERYHRVVVREAGLLQDGRKAIRLAGIEAPSLDRSCTDDAGQSWPCGRAAAAQLRLFVRHRAIDCEEVGRDGDVLLGRCRIGQTDLAEWLVDQGWALPAEPEIYADAAEAAKADRRGMHAAEWRP